jgi:hypothetical protein
VPPISRRTTTSLPSTYPYCSRLLREGPATPPFLWLLGRHTPCCSFRLPPILLPYSLPP